MYNVFKNRLILIGFLLKNKIKETALTLTPLALVFTFVLTLFYIQPVESVTIQNDKLIEKISKDYTNKFCNSIAFGLSKKSAMEFSSKENNLIYKNKKGINSLDKSLLANKIAISVVENCGYIISLKGEEGINQFENEYLLMNNSVLQEN